MLGKECSRVRALQSPAATKVPIKPLRANKTCLLKWFTNLQSECFKSRTQIWLWATLSGGFKKITQTPRRSSNRRANPRWWSSVLLSKIITGHGMQSDPPTPPLDKTQIYLVYRSVLTLRPFRFCWWKWNLNITLSSKLHYETDSSCRCTPGVRCCWWNFKSGVPACLSHHSKIN